VFESVQIHILFSPVLGEIFIGKYLTDNGQLVCVFSTRQQLRFIAEFIKESTTNHVIIQSEKLNIMFIATWQGRNRRTTH